MDNKPRKLVKKALVADDMQSSVMLLSEFLRKHGYVVKEASTAERVLTLLDGEWFDVVLLNLNMPPLRGVEYVQLVKRRVGDARLVVVTADTEDALVPDILAAGANALLTKPVDFAKLLSVVA